MVDRPFSESLFKAFIVVCVQAGKDPYLRINFVDDHEANFSNAFANFYIFDFELYKGSWLDMNFLLHATQVFASRASSLLCRYSQCWSLDKMSYVFVHISICLSNSAWSTSYQKSQRLSYPWRSGFIELKSSLFLSQFIAKPAISFIFVNVIPDLHDIILFWYWI